VTAAQCRAAALHRAHFNMDRVYRVSTLGVLPSLCCIPGHRIISGPI
jgi:hypothetical protein